MIYSIYIKVFNIIILMHKSNNITKIDDYKPYHTRSFTNRFEKLYDFDKSSQEWNKNKIKLDNCTYKYLVTNN